MDITLVPYHEAAGHAVQLLPYLTMSAHRSRGRVTESDIMGFIRSGQMMLWMVHDGEAAHGFIATEVKHYPRCKMLTIQYCAMTTGVMAEVDDKMQDIAARFAKDAGCAGIEFTGRAGWRQTARKHGYTSESVVYQKFFKES